MKDSQKFIADDLLELSSSKRIDILSEILMKNSSISQIAKKLDSTNQEIHRNVQRLEKNDFIEKNRDGNYQLTNFGLNMLKQLHSMSFLSKNKKYFKKHSLEQIPAKFIQRIGQLENSENVKGFVKVHEKWNLIYENAEKYIYNILYEVSYDSDIINTLIKLMNQGIKIKSIFSESAIVSTKREQVLKKNNFEKFTKLKILERKMTKENLMSVTLNEKQAAICFPDNDGEIDLSTMFYSEDPEFHDWCLDYFNEFWNKSSNFQEHKISK